MSREQKLALILGFLAVLVVAMLISDHYSKANKDRLAADVADSPQMIDPATPSPYSGPLAANTPAGAPGGNFAPLPPTNVDATGNTANEGLLSRALDSAGQNTDSQLPVDPALGHEPVRISQGRPENSPGVVDRIADGIGNLPAALNPSKIPTEPTSTPSQVDEAALRRQLDAAARQSAATPGTPGPVTPVTPAPAKTDAPAAERWHIVAANDSLFAISKKYYGDGKYWKKLAEANKGRMGSNNTLRPGVRLLIPNASALGIAVPAGPKVEPVKPDATKPDAAKPLATKPDSSKPDAKTPSKPGTVPAAKTDGRLYEVKKGDTLGQIAMRELGSSKRANEILTLNKLSDADDIHIGQKLKLPAK